jgi:hypothetical protein
LPATPLAVKRYRNDWPHGPIRISTYGAIRIFTHFILPRTPNGGALLYALSLYQMIRGKIIDRNEKVFYHLKLKT